MRIKRLGLTAEQRKRGVLFSSQLVNSQTGNKGIMHEVMRDEPQAEKERKIALLSDASAFDGKVPQFEPIWDENILRE